MLKSRFGYKTRIPSISSSKGSTKQLSFKDGRNTQKDNDDVKPTELVEAIDARFSKIGRYKTRKGLDHYTVPIGELMSAEITSVVGAGVYTINGTNAIAQKFTATRTERITKAEVRLRSTATSAGVLLVEYYTNNAGIPGTLIACSSLRASDVTASFTWLPVYFILAPQVTTGDVLWQVIRGQDSTVKNFEISTTTSATTALSSATAGVSWVATTYATNMRLYTAPSAPVKGLIRAYRPNGLKISYFASGSTVYSVNDADGTTTAVKTGLDASATAYRFAMVQDQVTFVNGKEKPWVIDLTSGLVTQLTQCPIIPDDLMEHKGIVFYKDTVDTTKVVYTNFADYSTFTSTDFIYLLAPKSADGLTAFAKLNGVLYEFAHRNKFSLLGSDNDTFYPDEAPSQRGTFTQESVVFDTNFIYHADEEGVHKFNGTNDINLAESFLDEYLAIPNKNTIVLELYRNHLYIFYGPAGSATNTKCFVYNLLLDRMVSLDTNTPIGRTFSRYAQDDIFIQASNLVAALYYGELDGNDYHNLGAPLKYELRTAYSHFDQPGSRKRAPKWRPQFPSVSGSYKVQVGYDLDMSGVPVYQDVDITGSGPRFNTGLLFNTGVRFAGQRMVEPNLFIPGEFKRAQRRYRHIAAREPVELDSEVLAIEVQRLN